MKQALYSLSVAWIIWLFPTEKQPFVFLAMVILGLALHIDEDKKPTK